MNFGGLLNGFKGNAETLLFSTAMHFFTTGKVDLKHLDVEPLAVAASGLLSQLEAEDPGIAAKYGWVRVSDAAALGEALNAANQAYPPSGLEVGK
jgi:hypothetical protein